MKKEKLRSIEEALDENTFYSKMAMQKSGHVGLMAMAIYIMQKRKGKNDRASKTLLIFTMILLILDDVELVIHECKKLTDGRHKENKNYEENLS